LSPAAWLAALAGSSPGLSHKKLPNGLLVCLDGLSSVFFMPLCQHVFKNTVTVNLPGD
jgi:hypothetical protein